MPDAVTGPVLRVQTVLYQNELSQIWRMLWGLVAAVRNAREHHDLGRVQLAIGDCSPARRLTDDDVAALRESAAESIDEVTYEFFDANLGSSGGHNRLAESGASDYLLVMNPDTYPAPRMLVELIGGLDDPTVAIVEARQLPLEHPKLYDPVTGDTSWASTCCLVVRRSVFDAVDGFDHDHFPLYCDDVDFSWRVRLAGHRVVVAPLATIFHDKRPEAGVVWVASDIEVYHSLLGRLMLATRYGRPDIFDETVRWVTTGGPPKQKEALAEFQRRAGLGQIPERAPGAERVAQFVDGEYAVHRF